MSEILAVREDDVMALRDVIIEGLKHITVTQRLRSHLLAWCEEEFYWIHREGSKMNKLDISSYLKTEEDDLLYDPEHMPSDVRMLFDLVEKIDDHDSLRAIFYQVVELLDQYRTEIIWRRRGADRRESWGDVLKRIKANRSKSSK